MLNFSLFLIILTQSKLNTIDNISNSTNSTLQNFNTIENNYDPFKIILIIVIFSIILCVILCGLLFNCLYKN